MSLIKWSPIVELDNIINDAFSSANLPNSITSRFRGQMPIDVRENKDDVVVTAQVPGIKEKDIDISIDNNVLTIKVEQVEEKSEKDEQGNFLMQEIFRGSSARQIPLPTNLETESCQAKLKDGQLQLTFPKKEEAKPKRIAIQSN